MSNCKVFYLPKRQTAPDINERTANAWRFIQDAARHPSKPSDDFIVKRAVGLLRHG